MGQAIMLLKAVEKSCSILNALEALQNGNSPGYGKCVVMKFDLLTYAMTFMTIGLKFNEMCLKFHLYIPYEL
jgi:hypothetical protein